MCPSPTNNLSRIVTKKGLYINLTSFVYMLNFVIKSFCFVHRSLENPYISKFVQTWWDPKFKVPDMKAPHLVLGRRRAGPGRFQRLPGTKCGDLWVPASLHKFRNLQGFLASFEQNKSYQTTFYDKIEHINET